MRNFYSLYFALLSMINSLLMVSLLLTPSTLYGIQIESPDIKPVRQNEIASTHERLRHYQAARVAWIDSVCQLSEAQKHSLRGVSQKILTENVIDFERDSADTKHQYAPIFDHTILQFANIKIGSRSLHTSSFETQLRALLTSEQFEKMEESLHRRSELISHGYALQITNIIDDDLFLTSSQRPNVCRAILEKRILDQNPFPVRSYMRHGFREAISEHDPLHQIFSPMQIARWNDLTKPNPEIRTGLGICANEKPISEWDMELFLAANSVNEKYERAIRVRTDYVANFAQLDHEASRTLELAARGISFRDLQDWRGKMHGYYFELAESMYASSCVMISVPQRPKDVESHPIWQRLSSRYNFQAAMSAREQEIRRDSQEFVVAALDEELWLTKTQREQLRPVIEKVLQTVEIPTRSPEYSDYPDILLLARFLVQDSIVEIEPLLNNEQRIVFQQLRSQFVLKNQAILWNQRYGKNQPLGFIRDSAYREHQLHG